MESVEALVRRSRRWTSEIFVAEHPAPVLVARQIIGGRLGQRERVPVRRDIHRFSRSRLKSNTLVHIDPTAIDDPCDDDILVTRPLQRQVFVRVAKSPATPREVSIRVGRFASCDVVINDYTVSKRHAFIEIDPLLGHFRITDTHSTNGTAIDGLPLVPGVPTPLRSRQFVTFGRLIFQLLGPHDFFDYLRMGPAEPKTVDVQLR